MYLDYTFQCSPKIQIAIFTSSDYGVHLARNVTMGANSIVIIIITINYIGIQ